MPSRRTCSVMMVFGAVFATDAVLHAEIPLPPAIVFGVASRNGQPANDGRIVARVSRNGRSDLDVPGEFVEAENTTFYVVRIPMETAIGAPSANGTPEAARGGDVLEVLLLDDRAGPTRRLALREGTVVRHDEDFDNLPPTTRFVRGDADSSGGINLTDGVVTLNALFRSFPIDCQAAADTDDSGSLNLTDAVRVFQWLFQNRAVPAPPSPTSADYPPGDCGTDPTEDRLGCESPAAKCV